MLSPHVRKRNGPRRSSDPLLPRRRAPRQYRDRRGAYRHAQARTSEPSLSKRLPILDIGGDLVLRGRVDGHMQLDKTLMGLQWMPHTAGPTRMSLIETDKTLCRTGRHSVKPPARWVTSETPASAIASAAAPVLRSVMSPAAHCGVE
jgi:hypothetical protein